MSESDTNFAPFVISKLLCTFSLSNLSMARITPSLMPDRLISASINFFQLKLGNNQIIVLSTKNSSTL